MPKVNHYEGVVEIRFEISGPVDYAEATALVQERATRALVDDDVTHLCPVKASRIAEITITATR